MPILPKEVREATTVSRFPDKRDSATRRAACYPGTNSVRTQGGVSSYGAETRSHIIVYAVGGRASVDHPQLLEARKE